MGFLQKIKSSIFDPDFYSKIKHQSLGSALKYFFLLVLFLTAINTIILAYELGIKVPAEIKSFVNESVMNYPSDLEVNIDNGQVSTNAPEPFFVPFPDTGSPKYDSINNLLVIDTQTPFSSTQFDQYKTMFWLTKDSLFYANREYDQRSITLKDFDNFTINKQLIEKLATTVSPWFKLVGPGLIILTFFGLFLGYTFNLIYLLFLAVLIFFLSAIFRWGLNYSASYKTAIYASSLGLILDLALLHTGTLTGFYGFPFFFTLTVLCVATINLQNTEKKS